MDIDIKSPFWSPAGASGFILDWDGVIAETRLDFTPLREKYYGGRRAMLLEEAHTLAPETREEFFAELVALEMAGAEKPSLSKARASCSRGLTRTACPTASSQETAWRS